MVLCCWHAIVLVPASQLQDHALSAGVISRSERDEICTAPFYISFSQPFAIPLYSALVITPCRSGIT
jgi:hypothetical protein